MPTLARHGSDWIFTGLYFQDILLTDRFYNVDSSRFSSAYVRISNARSVHVTEAFMRQWQQVRHQHFSSRKHLYEFSFHCCKNRFDYQ